MKKRIIILSVILVCIIGILIFIFKTEENDKYYKLSNDNIISITSLVGERPLRSKKTYKRKDIIVKTYKYKRVKDPYTDLSKYISYLEDTSNFIPTKSYNLNKKKGTIQISRYSTDKNFIVVIDISYNKHSYTIKITRGKGSIDTLNNS